MESHESEGLGLSLLVYVGAIFGALAVLAVPAYFATRADVYENPPLARSSSPLSGPIVGTRTATRFPLARLEQATLVDPAILAGLNVRVKKAQAKKTEPEHPAAHRMARRPTGTPVAELQPERRRPTFSLFSLFGG